ncbi:MAG: S9 family peptidase [Brevundimonas sp.]|nr:MAG: S9 family peptidase [Brevundimonas sp.]
MKPLVLAAVLAALATPAFAQTPPPHMPTDLSIDGVRAADDHLALEQVNGAEAMAFVHAENERSLAALTGDPRYETFRREAEAILTATDRIAQPSFLGEGVGNFWQDATNPKGVWRRTSLAGYRSDSPQWDILLDIDALSRAEGKDWVFKGADCLAPDETRCLVNLSDGGKDAVVVREFDLATKAFVDGGFNLPEGKHRIEWLDRDTLLVATDFGPENGRPTMTESGYPFIVKSLKRGQTLAQATEVYRGDLSDGGYGVSPSVYRDGEGNVQAVLISRPLDTYRQETWQLVDGKPVQLDLPERLTIWGVTKGLLIFSNDQAWRSATNPGLIYGVALRELPQGARPAPWTGGNPDLVWAPGERQSVQEVSVLDGKLVVAISDNVTSRLLSFDLRPGAGRRSWLMQELEVPANSTVNLGDSSKSTGRFFWSVEGFLTPSTLNLADAAGATEVLKSAPARFDASGDVVEQFEATSTDGTKIPYFVVRPRDLAMDGTAPTIIYGYGGFQVSKPPAYIPEMGKLWLENGGVYVIANIRGGGEFGPNWHQSVLKENRQLAFDDFAAVARDLQDRRITSPRRTGIYGRSNGGVLTSVSITQHPELYNAAVIESPLIDMLRYWDLPAGASWIGEYGDPRIPEEAAYIARYSGYQNLRPGADYPRVYITTNTRDDRVHPGHARKFAARLGDLGYDHLYYEETSGGHSNDADPVANARRWARHYTYLAQQLMD